MTKKERKRKKKLQMYNKRLIKKYYWLMPRNVWTDKILKDYDYTFINWGWCDGWDKAFGMMYLEELGAEIKRIGQKDFRILQQKEKYGSCRNYTSGTSDKALSIIRKYEIISQNICCRCGCEAPMIDDGWVSPYCFDCWVKIQRRREKYYLENNLQEEPESLESLQEKYNEYICDKPQEDGSWLPMTYTVRHFSKDGDYNEVIDISETVNRIRRRQEKWKGGKTRLINPSST